MWGQQLAGRLVVLQIDSMVVLYCLESISSKTLVFIPLLRAIADILLLLDIRLKLTYVSTTANILADCLSRGGIGFQPLLDAWRWQLPNLERDFEHWMLHTRHFRSLGLRDAFTSCVTFALSRFMSPPASLAVAMRAECRLVTQDVSPHEREALQEPHTAGTASTVRSYLRRMHALPWAA
jgi:hypothetical protein